MINLMTRNLKESKFLFFESPKRRLTTRGMLARFLRVIQKIMRIPVRNLYKYPPIAQDETVIQKRYRYITLMDAHPRFFYFLLSPLTAREKRVALWSILKAYKYNKVSEDDGIQRSYIFLDRVITRAQTLLQFNSIILAITTLSGQSSGITALKLASVTLSIASSIGCLLCLLFRWYHPLDYKNDRGLVFTWKIVMYRGALLNACILISAIATIFTYLSIFVQPSLSQ